jgi:hypothetical protein
MKVHMYDFRWLNSTAAEIQASSGEQFGKKALSVGNDVSLEICSDVKCGGSFAENTWSPCPSKSVGKSKCEVCRAREKNFVFTVFDGFNRENVSESDLQKIAGPHVVYLALFDKNLIKVGVSKRERKELRQLEQGAHYTLFIAETSDGILARQIETLLRKSGLVDKIKPSQKKEFLCPEIAEKEGEEILRKVFESHKEVFQDHALLQNFLTKTPEFISWKSAYHLTNIEKSAKAFHSVTLNDKESVSGKIISMKGPFLVIETPDELVSVCAKDLLGREIEFEEKPAGLILRSAFQSALF